jgi:uncharacterized membrane protein YbhN (UPF0104 family)
VHDVNAFADAVGVFIDRLRAVEWAPLGIAVAFHVTNLLFRTRAWWSILRAAYPKATYYKWRSTAAAYLSGVGVNAIAPARGGDLVKLYLVRLKLVESSTATVVSTLLVETLFDSFIGIFLMLYAWHLGVIPSPPDLPSLPAFEWSYAVEHPRVTVAICGVILLVALYFLRRAIRAAVDFWARVRQGFAILRRPRTYFRRVVLIQGIGWCCRVGSVYYFLQAFGITASLRNALLVLVVVAAGTLMPFTPGGVGTQQALAVVVLAGEASRPALLSFSVGMQVALVVTNVIVGFLALAFTFRSLSIRKAIRTARESEATSRAAETAPPPAPSLPR